jgi:MFS family permease
MGPVAGRLADRVGPRPLMALGLVFVSISLFAQSFLAPDTPYGTLALAFALMGVGMGLVMSPMSTAAMNAVDQTKAGAASGVLSMSRMVGGTFGVAVTGALVTTLGRGRLTELLPGATSDQVDRLVDALATGGAGIPGRAGLAVQTAFLDAVNTSMKIGSVVALVGAVVAWLLIEKIPPRAQMPQTAEERLELDLVEAGDAGGAPQGEAALRQPARA